MAIPFTQKGARLMENRGFIFRMLAIVLAGVWIYAPVLHGDWLWDDDLYLTANPLLNDPDRLWKTWFAPGSFIEYYPIEETIQFLQWQLWHMDTFGYHATNVALHLVGALLVWRLLSKLGLRLAWLGGLIFAIHPVMVESVAWITEFKNTLSLPPFLLAMGYWIDFQERGKKRDYLFSLGWFVVAMLCKPTMVMFPVVILLYAWWKRYRIEGNDLKASAPFFMVSLVLGLMTIWSGIWFAQLHHQTPDPGSPLGICSRLALAGLSAAFYFSKAVLPVHLSPIYPRWAIDPPTLWQFLPWLVLGGMFSLLWTRRKTWGRHALLGTGFFLIMLLPFVMMNVGGYTNFTWVMDHFLYIPVIGLIGLFVAGLEQIRSQIFGMWRVGGLALVALMLMVLAEGSRAYARMFINEEVLSTYTLERCPRAWLAHYNLGVALMNRDRTSEATAQYDEALRLNPAYAQAHNNKGVLLLKMGRISEAIPQFQMALRSNPTYAQAHNNLGNALVQAGRIPEGINEYEQAVQIEPAYAEAYCDLGDALGKEGRWQEAIDQFQRALQIDPGCAEAQNDWGDVLLQRKQPLDALDHFQDALRIDPRNADALYNQGIVLAQMGGLADAIESYQEALRIKPDSVEIHNNLGIALALSGNIGASENEFREALQLDPNYTIARNNLTRLEHQTQIPAHKSAR